jgi:quinol monooxygenase YgiN
MIVVTGRMRIASENRERFAEVATEMCSRSREDDGCIGYRVYADLEQDGCYVFVEEWADEAALQSHFTQPHTGVFLGALGPLLAEPADALFHEVAATRKLDPRRGLVPVD